MKSQIGIAMTAITMEAIPANEIDNLYLKLGMENKREICNSRRDIYERHIEA